MELIECESCATKKADVRFESWTETYICDSCLADLKKHNDRDVPIWRGK